MRFFQIYFGIFLQLKDMLTNYIQVFCVSLSKYKGYSKPLLNMSTTCNGHLNLLLFNYLFESATVFIVALKLLEFCPVNFLMI